jgi:hypothetical protein
MRMPRRIVSLNVWIEVDTETGSEEIADEIRGQLGREYEVETIDG